MCPDFLNKVLRIKDQGCNQNIGGLVLVKLGKLIRVEESVPQLQLYVTLVSILLECIKNNDKQAIDALLNNICISIWKNKEELEDELEHLEKLIAQMEVTSTEDMKYKLKISRELEHYTIEIPEDGLAMMANINQFHPWTTGHDCIFFIDLEWPGDFKKCVPVVVEYINGENIYTHCNVPNIVEQLQDQMQDNKDSLRRLLLIACAKPVRMLDNFNIEKLYQCNFGPERGGINLTNSNLFVFLCLTSINIKKFDNCSLLQVLAIKNCKYSNFSTALHRMKYLYSENDTFIDKIDDLVTFLPDLTQHNRKSNLKYIHIIQDLDNEATTRKITFYIDIYKKLCYMNFLNHSVTLMALDHTAFKDAVAFAKKVKDDLNNTKLSLVDSRMIDQRIYHNGKIRD